ncbi:Fic family protein [Candidatus Pacearchaeota archaeon]|nr:Fic family protein [Candidatus Pacearchaeota archaeon]
MVYIYRKPIGDKNYYYLRISERKNKKVISKDIAYLGSSIDEVRLNLDKLKKYKEQIRKSYKKINSFLESNHFLEKAQKLKLKKDKYLADRTEEVEACKIHYYETFNKMDSLTRKEIFQNYIVEFAYNTASIEGNTINLDEARNLLNEGIAPKGKTLREIYDLQNTERVFFELIDKKLIEELSHELIIEIHDKLLEKIDERRGYRASDIRVIRSNFDASPGKYVKTDMNLLLKWFNENKDKLHPLVLAVVFHHKFEKVHPFMDGNGRTGRMVMNYILMKNKMPPTIIHKKTREEYLNAMRKADECDLWKIDEKGYSKLIEYGASEFIATYWNIFL